MQFNGEEEPVHIALFAVIVDDANANVVRQWLGTIATRVNPNLGVVSAVDVGTRGETSLELLETSYAADLSQLTWSGCDPVGAL